MVFVEVKRQLMTENDIILMCFVVFKFLFIPVTLGFHISYKYTLVSPTELFPSDFSYYTPDIRSKRGYIVFVFSITMCLCVC